MTQAEYQRQYYQRRKAGGRCLSCGGERGEGATVTRCAACKKVHRRQMSRHYWEKRKA